MKWTGLNELRESFLSFFESKEHLRLKSASLVPMDDKSLLLINAGMAPLKKYFTGEAVPPKKRCTSCQKCVRTPDIEQVGKTSRHGTYFEMLGNFSFGDYFKSEAIAFAWEYLTKELKISKERLHISVFYEDDEAYDIWTNDIGIKQSHIVKLGREDNFWEHGAGPCGPSTEIYVDRGKENGCGAKDCAVGCECDRFVEIWNLVFTQFENDGNNNYTRLKSPNIDTGMGLERLAAVMQNVSNIFEVDTIQNIMSHISSIAEVKYHENEKSDVSLRIITDHIRSTVFMISDGVIPSNVGRGYVLRRLLRRAARHGRLLGIERPFLSELVSTVIKENKNAYPELVEKEEYIAKVITMEEESFSKTIDTGLSVLSDMIKSTKSPTLSGEDAFKLQDTYGFPLDLTLEILEENNMTVDKKEFEALLEKAKDMARAARKDAGADAWHDSTLAVKDIKPTKFTGYTDNSSVSKILAIIIDGEHAEKLNIGDTGTIVLDVTPFYAESGGQIGDTGKITANDTIFEVSSVTAAQEGVYLHSGTVVSGSVLSVGETVNSEINAEKRLATKRNHTATHLLHEALRKTLGIHVTQAGSFVSPEVARFDFSHFSALTAQEIEATENLVNEIILSSLPVKVKEMDIKEAQKQGALALFNEKYKETVRVVKCGEFSAELCGGTHAENTGNIGLFKIISESSVAAGVRRIEAITGLNSLMYIRDKEKLIHKTAASLKTGNVDEISEKALSVLKELKDAQKQVENLKSEIAKSKTADLLSSYKEIGDIKLFTADMGEASANEVRIACDSAKEKGSFAVAVIGARQSDKGTISIACMCMPDAVKSGAHAGNIVREVAKLAGGSGGGKAESAMAGGKDISKLKQALDSTEQVVTDLLGG